MFDKILNYYINELKSRLVKTDEMETRITEIDNELDEINLKLKEKINYVYQSKKPDKKDYSFISRLLLNSYNKALSDYKNNSKKESYKNNDEKYTLEELKKSLELEKAKLIEQMEIHKNDNKIIEELLKNLNNIDFAVEYVITNNPELCSNVEFMNDLISVDIKNLKYDKTCNQELYSMVIEKLIRNINSEYDKYFKDYMYLKTKAIKNLEKYKDIIVAKPNIEGKYRIPLELLNDTIRRKFNVEEELIEIAFDVANIIDKYDNCNDRFPQEYGEKLQELWDNDNIKLGIHGLTDKNDNKETIDNIFKKGLKCSSQQPTNPALKYTTYVQDLTPNYGFVDYIDYDYQGRSNIILTIPSECFEVGSNKPIWGSNESIANGEVYILPEYVFGYVPKSSLASDEYNYDNRKIVPNNAEKESYQYFFIDCTNGELMDVNNKKI